MRHRHLSPDAVLRQPGWGRWLAGVLRLTDCSARATGPLLARCLPVASALGAAVSAVARRVAGVGRETARKGLAAARPAGVREREGRRAGGFRRALRRDPVPVAVDLHRRPYYGDRGHTPGVTGARSEGGANRFRSSATAVSL